MEQDKCSKYESLFVFSDENTLNKHLQECEECRKEAEVLAKVSTLLDEVKMYYHAKNKQKRNRLRAICASVFIVFSLMSLGVVTTNDDIMDTLKYGDTLSAEDLGFPVDSYGLLMVDEWTLKK